MLHSNVLPRLTGRVTVSQIEVKRGPAPAPVHLVFEDPVSGDFNVMLCLSVAEADELYHALGRPLEELICEK